MGHVTRIVIRHGARHRRAAGRAAALGEELGDVAHARGEARGARRPRGIAGQQRPVRLHVGAAARRVDDHVLDAGALERVDVRLASSTAVSCSPAWAWSAPQHAWSRGTTTSAPFLASTRAVARLCAAEGHLLDAAGEKPTVARFGAAAGGHAAGSGARSAAGGIVRQERLPRRQRPGQEPQQSRRARTRRWRPLAW